MERPDAYVICTSPRSGSTLLCRMLEQTGVAGAPESHFHWPTLPEWLADYDLSSCGDELADLRAVFAAALFRGRAGGALFALRLQRHSVPFFHAQLARLFPDLPTDLARLTAAFGSLRFIHLSREDKLAQAVSYVKAQQTGLWHRGADGAELERTAPPAAAEFDPDRLAAQQAGFVDDDAAWRAWFAGEAISPLSVSYEALAADPTGEVARVLGFLGCDPRRAEAIVPPVARLSDKVNQDWIAAMRRRG